MPIEEPEEHDSDEKPAIVNKGSEQETEPSDLKSPGNVNEDPRVLEETKNFVVVEADPNQSYDCDLSELGDSQQ